MGFITNINSLAEVPRFEVIKEPLFDSRGVKVPRSFSLMRSDTRDHLGLCRESYRPVQLDEMLDIIDTATKRVGGISHIGYTFSRNGKRVVIQSKLNEDFNINGDNIEGIFYSVIDNSGMNSNKIIPSTRRIICDNMLHLVKSESEQGQRTRGIRHSNSFDNKVEDLIRKIEFNIDTVKGFKGVVERLQSEKFTIDQMRLLVHKLFPSGKNQEPSTKLLNKREMVYSKFSDGIGTEGKTKWDALNAITEYESHKKFTPEKLVRTLSTDNISNRALIALTA